MIKKILLLLLLVIFIGYQFANKKVDSSIDDLAKKILKVDKIINFANSFIGVSYKAGGTTKKGIDCSVLVNISFKQIGIKLPRSSSEISLKGREIALDMVIVGDLLFFDIARLKGGINHVGLVISIEKGEVFFVHSTTSKGVIISSMNETYWKNEFVMSKRIL